MIKNYCLSRKEVRLSTSQALLLYHQKEPASGSNLMVDCLTRRFYYNKKSPVWVGITSDIFIIFYLRKLV